MNRSPLIPHPSSPILEFAYGPRRRDSHPQWPHIAGGNMSGDTLTITDNRTGKQYELPVENGTNRAMDLRQHKVSDDDFGLMTYDPAFMNTASCKSRITFIDGDKGILEYRGYPIDQLAEKSTYLEVAYLLLNGELPTATQLEGWTKNITY